MNAYRSTTYYLKFKDIQTVFPDLKIYIGQEPDKEGVEQQLTLIPTGGFPNDSGDGGVEYLGIQFLVRDTSFDTCIDILKWVKKYLTNTTGEGIKEAFADPTTWDSAPIWDNFEQWNTLTSTVFGWENTSTISNIKKDEKNRYVFSDNYIIYNNEEELS